MGALAERSRPRRLFDVLLGLGVGTLVLFVVVLLGLQVGALPGSGNARGSPLIGTAAPDFALETPDGEVISMAGLRGERVWLTFWATWCPPCRTEMPDLQQVYRESPNGRYFYVAVNMGEDPATVLRYLRDLGYTLPTALDTTGEVTIRYRVVGLPTHFFIDEEGILKDIYVGVMSRSQMEERVTTAW